MIGIQLDETYDLRVDLDYDEAGLITSGLTLGHILPQNQALILGLHKGELKDNPAIGCGIADMLLDHDPLRWRHVIREQMELDGQQVSKIEITTTGIMIDAHY